MLWTLKLSGRVDFWTPTFLGHAKFETKNFSEFFCLQSTVDYCFWSCQIWGQIFFRNFSLTNSSGLWFFWGGWGSRHQLFLVMPNLRSKSFQNFFLYCMLWTQFYRGGSGPTFFGHTKFEVKKFSELFPLPSTLDSEFFGRGFKQKFFWVMPNLRPKIFQKIFLYQVLWSLKFSVRRLIQAPTFFGHAKFEVNNFQNFFIYNAPWTLNFSEEGLDTNFFWSCLIWSQKIFRIFSFTKCSGLWIFWRELQEPTLFWSHQIWDQKFFRIFSFTISSGLWIFWRGWGSRHQLFLVMLNLRSNIFRNFFIYRVLWTLNFWEGGLVTNFFWLCHIWGQCNRLHLTNKGSWEVRNLFLAFLSLCS